MSQLLLINPRRRRSSKRRARRMSAKQLRYFGPRTHSNPSRRRRSSARTVARRVHRRARRGFSSAGHSISASMPSVISAVKNGMIGGGGAIAVDLAMGQVARFLPVSMSSRYDTGGGINYAYYATKAALAIGIAVLGQRMLPGQFKGFAVRGAEGSLIVMSNEILRTMIPATWTMGYFNPGAVVGQGNNVTNMGKYLNRAGMGKYLSGMRGSGGGSAWSGQAVGNDSRIGEGAIR